MKVTIGRLTRKGKIHIFPDGSVDRAIAKCQSRGKILFPVDTFLYADSRGVGFCVGCRNVLRRELAACPQESTAPELLSPPRKKESLLRSVAGFLRKLFGGSRRK